MKTKHGQYTVFINRVPAVFSLITASVVMGLVAATGVGPTDIREVLGLRYMRSSANADVFSVSPNPMQVCSGVVGNATLSWSLPLTRQYEVRKDGADGPLVASGAGEGNKVITGSRNGDRYYLYGVETALSIQYNPSRRRWERVPTTSKSLLSQLVVQHTTQGCGIVPPSPTGELLPSGWDFSLRTRCVQSPNGRQSENYFEDAAGCGQSQKHWTLANQSEPATLGSCPGPLSQSFPINSPGSPLHYEWHNGTVRLLTNFNDVTHPCGSGYFTWFAFMDHGDHGGGPLPAPNKVQVSADLYYNDYTPSASSRLTFGLQVWWDGKSHIIEVDPYVSSNWGDAHPDADIINNSEYPSFQFVHLNGSALGITVERGKNQTITVPWHTIVKNLVDRAILPKPRNWNQVATQATYIATEFKNDVPRGAGSADLWFSNYKVQGLR